MEIISESGSKIIVLSYSSGLLYNIFFFIKKIRFYERVLGITFTQLKPNR